MVNGKSDSSTSADVYTLKLLSHLPALLSGSRKQAMVIGLGTGVTASELGLYADIERIDIAEISPAVIEALPLFHEFTNNLHKDPRVNVELGDAFRVLGRSDRQWNLIVSEPSNPWVSGVDLLFTQEFYRLVKEHLAIDGILAQWFHLYAADSQMVAMVLNTLQQEFQYCRGFLANPGDLIILASNSPIPPKRLVKAEAFIQQNPRVKASLDLINLGSLNALLSREIWSPSYIRASFSEAGLQTMDNPRLHYIAGKQFFMGSLVSQEMLFNAATAKFSSEYLLVNKSPDWQKSPLTPAQFDSFLLASEDSLLDTLLPAYNAFVLKAHLANPELFPLDDNRQEQFRPDLVHLISRVPESEDLWKAAGLQDASVREKASILLQHVQQTRSWIVPYPLHGLKALLESGLSEDLDAYDHNWCTLQLALLLAEEYRDQAQAAMILQQLITDANGLPLLAEADSELAANVNRVLAQTDSIAHE
jgi:spermidine synthase